MNFDHYIDNNQPNPKRAALLSFAAVLALSGTTMMILAGWVAGKMSIARVEPPSMEYVLLSLSVDEPPPPPPPPPPPAGQQEVEDEKEPDDEIPDDPELIEEPEVVPTKIPSQKAGATVKGHPNGIPGGQDNGIPGGSLIGIPIGSSPRTRISVKPRTPQLVTKQPLAAVMARAVYSPDPSQKLLQQTKAARFDKRKGKNTTSFCIDSNGRVVDVKTRLKFPGDPKVDEIIRKAIKNWRFKPSQICSKKMKTCTERTFALTFQ